MPAGLQELLGTTATVLFLDLGDPDQPVREVGAVVRTVNPRVVVLELRSALPRAVDSHCRFGVLAEGPRGLIRFQTVPAKPYPGGSSVLVLTAPVKVETTQRRRYSRVTLGASVFFGGTRVAGDGTAVNLSASGMLFLCGTPLHAGSGYAFDLELADGQRIEGLTGRVTRCMSHRSGQWLVAVKFSDQTATQELTLVKLVWREQFRQSRSAQVQG